MIKKEIRFFHQCDTCGKRTEMPLHEVLRTDFILFGRCNIDQDGFPSLTDFFRELKGDHRETFAKNLKDAGRIVCTECYDRLMGYLKIIDTHEPHSQGEK